MLTYLHALLLFCGLFSMPLQAQEKGVFWKISGPELEKPSYLFGTIHLICEQDFKLSEEVAEKLKYADALVLEVDMDDPALALSMLSRMQNEDGESITDYLSEEEYKVIRQMLIERTGMDLDMLKTMRPFILMTLIYPNLLECETKSYEHELMKVAKAEEMDILGLESIDDQLSIFDRIPLDEQYRSFYEYAENLDRGRQEFRKLINTYLEEDIALLVKMVSESPEYRAYQDILLDKRNHNWIAPMQELMKGSTVFFAVGAGHLGGENGLLNLLRKEGYTLTRMGNGKKLSEKR
ncbi:TraB/GumN family protein [Pleomorphovibrio marinus]|uniref:TraB/GumN family protein n=1 Tax=Pleomorphovibrio marinus TaxID=2164132 RepID=UPI001E56CD81|nr:TraB/GumN family protein [Pleomorphovibrio marinus]